MSFGSFADKIYTIYILKPGDHYELLMISNFIGSPQDKAVLLLCNLTVKNLVARVDCSLKVLCENDVTLKLFSPFIDLMTSDSGSHFCLVHFNINIGSLLRAPHYGFM